MFVLILEEAMGGKTDVSTASEGYSLGFKRQRHVQRPVAGVQGLLKEPDGVQEDP